MSGAGFGSGFGDDGGLLEPVQRAGADQQTQFSADIKTSADTTTFVDSPMNVTTAATASMDPTRANAALNLDLPGSQGGSARISGGPQQAADGYGPQSGSTTDPFSAADSMRAVDPTIGGQSADAGQSQSPLSQPPLSRQMTAALEAAGYSRSSNGPGGVASPADDRSPLAPIASEADEAVPDPASGFGQAPPGGPTITIGGPQTAALFGAGILSNTPDGALAPGTPDTLQQALAATPPGPEPAAVTVEVAAAPGAARASLPALGPSQAVFGDVAMPRVGAFAGPSSPAMPTPGQPAPGVAGTAFTAETTVIPNVVPGVMPGVVPGPVSTGGTPSMPDPGVPNAATALAPTFDRQAVNGLALPFVAAPTKIGPAPSVAGVVIARPGMSGETDSVTSVAPIPGSLTSGRPVSVQTAPSNPDPTAAGAPGALPRGVPLEQTTPLPGLPAHPGTAGLASPMAARPATLAGLPAGALAYGFGPLPVATPQALLTPGITTSTNGRGRRPDKGGMVAYAEHRPVLLDLAPIEPEAPSWRLDDTETLVSVGANGVAAARERAVALYSALMEQGEGLAALRPGEGFVTWDGSPLWLSLAGIAKPGTHGVLPNIAVPGRVQVQRAATGEWVVEHASRASPVSRPVRHDAASVDDDSLSSDVLYGVTAVRDDNDRSRRFARALSALRFAFGLAPPARWRSAEAWASVARLCAASAMHIDDALTPPSEAALQSALSVVVTGLAPSHPKDALSVPPLSRERFLKLALSGDGERMVAALRGLGRGVLDRLRRGVVDDLDRLDTLALAVCLGRLARTIPQSPSNAAASSRRGAAPAARSVLARSVHAGRRW
jgi:hypothetical protein